LGLFSGKAPTKIGVNKGQLGSVDMKPWNAVSSFAESKYHKIAPLAVGANAQGSFQQLKSLIEKDPMARIIKAESTYLYAEYKTKLLGFVDDVEFLLDPKGKVIHVRSASRLGRKDFGVNRQRIESIRARLTNN
jgi:uncharacterized protein (DUF1499 family)